MQKINFLSASDRNNYGDLLFPLVFSEFLKKATDGDKIENYGLVDSDLSDYGALKTKSFKHLEKSLKQGDKLIIGGGEVLFPRWTLLYSYINSMFNNMLKFRIFKKIESKLLISKRILSSGKHVFPFTPKFDDTRCYYNSVGGIDVKKLTSIEVKEVKRNLCKAEIVSVRDNQTAESLLSIGVDTIVVPDSALLMSDFFPLETLSNKTSEELNNLPDEYIFLQIGASFEPKDLKLFSEELKTSADRSGYKVVCCPIGLAPNHEDHKVLRKICDIQPDFIYINPQNLYDVMYTIASSKVYFGTSLHGLITAMSFERKFIPLNSKVHKMSRYAITWAKDLGVTKCFDYHNDWKEIEDIINSWDFTVNHDLLTTQKSMIYKNFNSFIS